MQWLELCIQTCSAGIELVGERLTVLGYDSFIVDDQAEFETFLEQNKQYWDYVDQGLQEKMEGLSQIRLYLEDNETAAAIAEYVGQTAWQLPIYHYDDFEGWEVMQYYDIPSRYEIPSSAASVTSELAGEVYYSEPNRIVLFYHDAEISGEYTLIGHFDATEEFVTAVEENPVLEGWGNKIVQISAEE